MKWGKHILEAATIIVAAVVCALVANAFASRERKLVVVSHYSTQASRPAVTKPLDGPPRAAAPTPNSAARPPGAAALQPNAAARPPRAAALQPNAIRRTAEPPATKREPPTASSETPIDRFPPHPDKAYIEVHYDDVAWLHAHGALFLDARRTSVYEDGHIAGARPFSVWESDIDDKVNKLFAERSDPSEQNKPIVAYCSGGDCEDSHMLAQKLWGIQFNNLYVYKDGFPDWQAHGGAIDSGANP